VPKKSLKTEVEVNNIQQNKIDTTNLEALVCLIWRNECRNSCDIRIVLTNDVLMSQLNQRYLKKDTLTDVIAFPIEETDDLFEGEIYINVDQVLRNAGIYDVVPGEELKRIVAHGTLHFAGYGDKTFAEKRKMTEREDCYLAKLFSINQ